MGVAPVGLGGIRREPGLEVMALASYPRPTNALSSVSQNRWKWE